MILGKHINRYYLKYGLWLLLGVVALVIVDYFNLKIPNLYQMIINGMGSGSVEVDGQVYPFDMDFLIDKVCMPMLGTILCIVAGRFIWRAAFFTAASTSHQKRVMCGFA